ncbi:MAG: hypothetical protein IKF82_06210 [Bacilli bacterium]|nr:hypothetical protein [Bacilli bacterium]MBR3209842.1 hypothetical protein [Bacilli bacterium]
MKKEWFASIIVCISFLFCLCFKDEIVNVVMKKYIHYKTIDAPKANSYYMERDFELVKRTNDFHINNYQDILDIIYTILDNGSIEFTFYCDESYGQCVNDFDKVSQDQVLLSTINNMVSPYNSYKKVYFKRTSYGEITMKIDRLYSDEDVRLVNEKIDSFINSNINDSMSMRDKIKAFHDYLINNSIYDKERASIIENGGETGFSNSHKAIGPLVDGLSLCSGYSDAMKIFLDKLGIANYKISNSRHIWNLVYIDGSWLHLDLTWDDPITNDGENLLLYSFFLIDTDALLKLDSEGHTFNPDYYKELSH